MPWFIVGIAGCTNSGKTTMANKLKEIYPGALQINQDNYFLTTDDPSEENCCMTCPGCSMLWWCVLSIGRTLRHVIVDGLGHINWELITSIDMDKMVEDIDQIIRRDDDQEQFRLLILDGFLLFADRRIVELCHAMVYLDVDEATCRQRRVVRVYDPPDVPGYFENVVWPHAMIARGRALESRPDLIVLDGRIPQHALLDILVKIIRRKSANL